MWDILFRLNLTDDEKDDFSNLLLILNSIRICLLEEDSQLWLPDSSGCFSFKSFYVWNNHSNSRALVNPAIWSSKALPWASSFLWTMGLGKIDNLHKRGRTLASACSFFFKAPKDVDHLLIHCTFSSAVWNSVLDHFSGLCLHQLLSFPLLGRLSTFPSSALLCGVLLFLPLVGVLWWGCNNKVFRNIVEIPQFVRSRIFIICASSIPLMISGMFPCQISCVPRKSGLYCQNFQLL